MTKLSLKKIARIIFVTDPSRELKIGVGRLFREGSPRAAPWRGLPTAAPVLPTEESEGGRFGARKKKKQNCKNVLNDQN